jgi:hypothetical protein
LGDLSTGVERRQPRDDRRGGQRRRARRLTRCFGREPDDSVANVDMRTSTVASLFLVKVVRACSAAGTFDR